MNFGSFRWWVSMGIAIVLFGCGAKPETPVSPTSPEIADAGPKSEGTDAPLPVHAEITAFVLTKCPYAAELIRTLVALHREMGARVEISLGYLGLVDEEGNIDPGMGAAERQTAAMQVCVSAKSTTDQWFDYLDCAYKGEAWRTLPTGWETCAASAGVSVDDVSACVESGNGEMILAQAYGAAMASRITGSPTVFIDGFLYGRERTPEAMKQFVCHMAGKADTRPKACDGVPAPQKIAATMVFDPRCAGLPACDVEGEIAVLERLIPGFELSRVSFAKEEGRALFDAVRAADVEAQKLPLVVVQDSLENEASLKELLGDYLLPFGDGYVFALGGGWDPLAEICDNGTDDNADGKVDCDDITCGDKLMCRTAVPRRLDLFVMSECPFALELLPTVNRLLTHFERDEKKLDFNLQFIGEVGKDDALMSMHGESEVEEDLRMLCAQSLYRKGYKFMDYVVCRAEAFDSPAWEQCVPKGMSSKKIAECASGKKGRALLKESFELADALGVTGSPSWILNNKEEMFARQLDRIVSRFCARNEAAECEKEIAPVSEAKGDASSEAVCR